MASNIELLNKLGSLEQKPLISLKELEENTEYKILNMKRIKGKFGKCIFFECEEFKFYLPNRFTKQLTDKMLDDIVKDGVKIKYTGLKDDEYATCEFCL